MVDNNIQTLHNILISINIFFSHVVFLPRFFSLGEKRIRVHPPQAEVPVAPPVAALPPATAAPAPPEPEKTTKLGSTGRYRTSSFIWDEMESHLQICS